MPPLQQRSATAPSEILQSAFTLSFDPRIDHAQGQPLHRRMGSATGSDSIKALLIFSELGCEAGKNMVPMRNRESVGILKGLAPRLDQALTQVETEQLDRTATLFGLP
jgi:hypothetical protein